MTALSQAEATLPNPSPRRTLPRVPGARRMRLGRLVPKGAQLAAVIAVAGTLVALSYGMNHTSYSVWGSFWLAPCLLILTLPISNRAARHDGQGIGRIVFVAAAVKVLVMPVLRYWMAFVVYGGLADSALYDRSGRLLAPLFRHGIYSDLGKISGTRFLEILTGQIYALTGPTRLGGFMVFSWLCFVGCYLFYRAFRIAYPDGDGRRYALLVFFFPTLLFWPSSIGKDAFMILILGASAIGTAHLLTGRLRGLAWLASGLWGAAILRPHMALLVGAGLVVASPLAVLHGDAKRDRRQRSRLGGVVLVLSLVVAGPSLIGVAQKFFGLDSLSSQTAQELLDETTARSGQFGSTFKTSSPNNPAGFVLAGGTVLFRPFPFEVHNVQAALASLEGLLLLALVAVSFRRLFRLPVELFRWPYIAFATAYTFAFIYAFSSIANFGILARQRAQLLPFLFVILCAARKADQRIPDSVSASR